MMACWAARAAARLRSSVVAWCSLFEAMYTPIPPPTATPTVRMIVADAGPPSLNTFVPARITKGRDPSTTIPGPHSRAKSTGTRAKSPVKLWPEPLNTFANRTATK